MLKRAVCIIMIFLVLCGCRGKDKTYGGGTFEVYFRSSLESKLVAEKRAPDVKPSDAAEAIKYTMGELIAGPSDSEHLTVMPEGLRLLNSSIQETTAIVDLSGEFYTLKGTDELFARFAVVNTLCSLPGITNVQIKVNGVNAVSKQTNKELGTLSKDDIVFSPQTPAVTETTTILLYYSRGDSDKLSAESRTIDTQNTLSMEKTVMNELLKGPKVKSLSSYIPPETKLLGIEINDSVCFVNLSEDFVSKFTGGSTSAISVVFSIVNSLTELKSVDRVQFLIEGKKGIEFGGFVFDEPIERNENIILK